VLRENVDRRSSVVTYVTVFNDSDSPVVVSDDGRVVGGGDWGTALTTDRSVKDALDADQLVKVEAPDGDTSGMNPNAVTALEQTARFNERRDQVAEWDKAALTKFAADNALAATVDDVGVADLRRLITESSVKLPAPAAAEKKAAPAPEQQKQDDKPSK
jgi:hypothetical protein